MRTKNVQMESDKVKKKLDKKVFEVFTYFNKCVSLTLFVVFYTGGKNIPKMLIRAEMSTSLN